MTLSSRPQLPPPAQLPAMMQVESAQQLDWAHDAFVALNDANMQHADKWAPVQPSPFTLAPALLSNTFVERYGQVTPPEALSPASPARPAREGSIPVEQLRNETPWLHQHQASAQPSSPCQLQLPSLPSPQSPQRTEQHAPKRRRTSRQASSSTQCQANNSTPPQQDANPQPPKRKRGRPKSQPQMVEAFTADGVAFHVSSARHTHLEKNRVAAHKCRQRKKEYINGLEGRARAFSAKNKALKENVAMLREEVLSLKNEVLRHAGCNFWAVDEYLARCAGDLLGMEAPQDTRNRGRQLMGERHDSIDSLPSHMADASTPDDDEDDFLGLDLLRDFEDETMEDQP